MKKPIFERSIVGIFRVFVSPLENQHILLKIDAWCGNFILKWSLLFFEATFGSFRGVLAYISRDVGVGTIFWGEIYTDSSAFCFFEN